ncbi:MAG: tetratricopeptide repeat protein [Planctomycetota bacterium]
MRSALVALALCATALAQVRELKQGRFEDPFWGIRYSAPELESLLTLGDIDLIFTGKCAGRVRVAIYVRESAQPRTAKEWRSMEATRLRKRDVEFEEGDELLFVEKDAPGLQRHQGRAFHTRGDHICFEIQAQALRKTASSAAALRAALGGLKVEGEAHGTLQVLRAARQLGRGLDDPLVLLQAGQNYAQGKGALPPIPSLAVPVLTRARAVMKEDSLTPIQLWTLHVSGGRALIALEKPKEAIAWYAEAEKAAHKLPESREERAAISAYNLACACSLAGELDKAFEALHRAYERVKPVTDGQVSDDKDLENLRRDPRWHVFWQTKVKG